MKNTDKNKILLVVPGGGDPRNKEYKKIYGNIKLYAEKIGFKKTVTLSLPGHFSFDDFSYWDCEKAKICLKQKMLSINERIIVFARSGGVYVTSMLLKDCVPQNLERAIFWGPSNFPMIFRLFYKNFEKTKIIAKEKGLRIDVNTFNSFYPIELLIQELPKELKIKFIFGELDEYSNFFFGKYLESINSQKNIIFQYLLGYKHEVCEYNEKYYKEIFK